MPLSLSTLSVGITHKHGHSPLWLQYNQPSQKMNINTILLFNCSCFIHLVPIISFITKGSSSKSHIAFVLSCFKLEVLQSCLDFHDHITGQLSCKMFHNGICLIFPCDQIQLCIADKNITELMLYPSHCFLPGGKRV